MENKNRIFSGMQPTGSLTLGNYLGALKNWVALQNEYDCYYCVVDMHAITVPKEPKDLRKNTYEVLANYIAAGLNTEQVTLFIQSHVSAHAELTWILNCFSYYGELGRMTQFKDKSKKQDSNAITAGLFTYPVLMAADILLYQADLVPVGEDQRQHLEITRDIAQRFNNRFGETFVVPEPYISTDVAKIMSLQDPESKMSKSDSNENSYVLITDSPDVIRRKFKRSVTDSIGVVNYTDEQPGVKNLINIYSKISNIKPEEIVSNYESKGYAKLKEDVAEVVIEELKPIQERIDYLLKNKDYLEKIYNAGAQKAEVVANKTLKKAQKKVGFIPR
ncbi:MAG TPA: tryptophan--tRNA ligase [Sedimentibacter sp.]|jgi:tryptophanyl-tRNA synthetase|nr:tryptophan--tRNA ligase [Sedimentibacter sp.]NLA13071.1 tryptophan--tRNA ligase [Tissierellia bacterium]HAS90993.1 tryptophan--tRNA ligase [Clostridiales bacterium]HOA19218.1 tryptophan--tRNA ligase [Sedimentibacter sp.]HOG62282.1 tryptophan--tRNA ligase [Sedimentibacter sp.]